MQRVCIGQLLLFVCLCTDISLYIFVCLRSFFRSIYLYLGVSQPISVCPFLSVSISQQVWLTLSIRCQKSKVWESDGQ